MMRSRTCVTYSNIYIYIYIYIGYAAEARRAVRPTSKLLEETTEARRDSREETSMLSRAVPAPVRSRYMHTSISVRY